VTASGGFLSLNNGGDTVTLAQADGTQLDQVIYGSEGGSDESLTRAPDLTGDFVQHETVADASYSPGTQADGTAFGGTTGARSISINELRHNQPGADSDEFIELYSENAATSLDGLSLVVLSGEFAPGKVDAVFDLSAGSFDSDGVFMLTTTALTTGTVDSGDIVLDQADLRLFGSPSTYLLVEGFTGAVDDDLDSNDDGTLDVTPWGNVLDSVSFVDGDSTADQSYSVTVVGPDGNFTWAGIAADPDGSDSYTQLAFGDTSSDTPGALNGGGVVTPPTGDTLISQVQGAGSASGMVGQTVTLTAIVVGDFQNGDGDANRNLGGFFLQEEAADHDSNAATSEGIFVYEGTGNLITDVALGDKVTITGTVSEYFGSTQVTATSVSIVEAGAVADVNTMAATVDLDGAGAVSDGNGGYVADLEAYEGMLINIPETLTVSEAFQMDRFGEIRLSAGGRPVQFTQENDPDAAGYAQHLQDVASDSIVYDDGKTIQNPTPFSEADLDGNGVVNTADGFGMGDTVTGATGVLGYSFNEFRMHSVAEGANTFVDTETREATPTSLDREADGAAPDLVVSSFNVLNFFTTLDNGGARSGPNNLEPRGAETAAEYERQLEKLLTTLDLMNADIIGLVELENEFQSDQNGDGLVAIEEIVKGMNAIDGAGIWAYVDPGRSYVDTGDAISVGMIYRTDKVTLSGPAQILDDSVVATLSGDYGSDGLFDGQSTNRAPLAANFTYDYSDLGGNPMSETFTVAVTHMKSKGGTGSGGNADQGDGAGNYNETRTEGVQALIEWLDADRAGGFADADQVVLGDFNAYAKEDPIDTMLAANYKNLEEEFEPGSTTFVFDGQTGTLDYAFASGDMMAHVTNAGAWNINSAEPDLYDYNLNTDRDLSTNERDPAIFDGDVPFRTSDHDPLLLGLNFTDELLFA
jgi:predicted extracellular nuclease